MATKKVKEMDLLTCRGARVKELKCSGLIDINNFSNSWSYLNVTEKRKRGKDGKLEDVMKLPFCKDCNNKLYQMYFDKCKDAKEALFYVCQLNNVPYLKEKVEKTFEYIESETKRGSKIKSIFGTYYSYLMRETSKHHMWQDFSDSDIDYRDIASHLDEVTATQKEMEQFELDWGKQEEVEDYVLLQYKYQRYTEGKKLTQAQETLYRRLCQVELAIRRNEEENESTKDDQAMMIKLMQELKISNFEENKDKTDIDRIIERQIWEIENTEPCEVVDKNEYSDYVDIDKKWGKHILRAVVNLVAGTKDYPDVTKEDWN